MSINTWSQPLSAKQSLDFPATADREYPLWGHSLPSHHPASHHAYYTSLLARSAQEHARAVEFALTGAENNGSVDEPAEGHAHTEGRSIMPWMALGNWHFWMGNASTMYGARAVNETSDTSIGLLSFVLPEGATHAAVRLRVYIPNGSTLTFKCKLRFDVPSNIDSATPTLNGGALCAQVDATRASEGWPEEWDAGQPSSGRWLESSFYDFSGFASTNGKRVIVCRLDASVSSDVAYVAEAQAILHPITYQQRPTKQTLGVLGAPAVALPSADLHTLWIQNPKRLRQLIFGTSAVKRVSEPHDHGERGGEPIDRPLASYLFGPHRPEGDGVATGGTEGLPLSEPSSSVDFTATPKLIVQAPLWVLGRVSEVRVRVALALPGGGTRNVSLKVEVRPLSDQGYGPEGRSGIAETLAFSFSGTRYTESSATIDLTSLGHTSEDRLFELCIWLVTNPPAASAYRLLSALVLTETTADNVAPVSIKFPRDLLAVAEVREGLLVTPQVLTRTNRLLNQVALEALGGVPGLSSDLRTDDTSIPWRQLLSEPHQHRGTYTDEAGNTIFDGAPIRLPLFAQFFGVNVNGGGLEDSTGSADATLGQPLLDNIFVRVHSRVSVPRGLRAFDLYLLVQPSSTELLSRLYVSLFFSKLSDGSGGVFGVNSITKIRTRNHNGKVPVLPLAMAAVLANPNDTDSIWEDNNDRLTAGLGLWSTDALITNIDLPSGTTSTNAARWTEAIRVEFEPPDPADWPTHWFDACDHRLALRAFVETGVAGSGVVDESARLLAAIAIPSRM